MAISPGARLGPYEILSAIGAGGMGDVYQSHATKLGRDVAIKVLPGAFANDPERLARFRRGAKMLAALNLPNFGAINGLEEHEGTRHLAMEYVSGESPYALMLVDDALYIPRQLVEALESAREKGTMQPRNFARNNAIGTIPAGSPTPPGTSTFCPNAACLCTKTRIAALRTPATCQ